MKEILKKAVLFLGGAAIAVTVLQAPTEVQAATSGKKVQKAYTTYLNKKIENCTYEDDINYYLYDFNKDGIDELVVSDNGGARSYYDVYTYKNKKVVSLISKVNNIGYINGKKYIVTYGSGGAYNFDYTVYKIKKNKLVKVDKYACVNGVYKKNGKKSDKSTFVAFEKTVITNLGTVQSVEKEYYSPEQLGISVYGSGTYTSVKKATNKKIYYYTYGLGEEQTTKNKSKLKSAKITSKTKFYCGDLTYLSKQGKSNKTFDERNWIYEMSKKQFINKMKTYSGANDRIVIKNGKVEKVFIHIQIAG